MPSSRLFGLSTLVAASLIGCGGDSSGSNIDTGPTPQPLTVNFDAVANGEPVSCDTPLMGLGMDGTTVELADLRFYIHDLALITDSDENLLVQLDQDTPWQHDNVALLDFQNRSDACRSDDTKPTNTRMMGTLPATNANIQGVRFTVGVPARFNHSDVTTAPQPLNIPAMFWNWQGGYKHMRIDVRPEGGIDRPSDAEFSADTWNFHLGATSCGPDPREPDNSPEDVTCEFDNRFVVQLDCINGGECFDVDSHRIQFDYGQLISNTQLALSRNGPSGCMSGQGDADCPEIFARLGLTHGDNPGAQQSVFKLVR